MWLVGFLAALAFQTIMFVIATRLRRDDLVDVGWGLSFVILVWTWWPIGQSSWSQLNTWVGTLIAVMITVWGLRLSVHILVRFLKSSKEDVRYTELKAGWSNQSLISRYLRIYVVQALLASLVALPAFIVLISCGASSWPLDSNQIRLIWIFVGVWAAGFTIEMVADWQLQSFLRRRTGHTTMQSGLWRYSRHPNYFGELVQWWAIGLLASLGIIELLPKVDTMVWASLFGPALLSYLIIKVSGIPPAEARAAKRPDWAEYRRRTSVLIPLPPRR